MHGDDEITSFLEVQVQLECRYGYSSNGWERTVVDHAVLPNENHILIAVP